MPCISVSALSGDRLLRCVLVCRIKLLNQRLVLLFLLSAVVVIFRILAGLSKLFLASLTQIVPVLLVRCHCTPP